MSASITTLNKDYRKAIDADFDSKEKVFSLTRPMTWMEINEEYHYKFINGWRMDAKSFITHCIEAPPEPPNRTVIKIMVQGKSINPLLQFTLNIIFMLCMIFGTLLFIKFLFKFIGYLFLR